MRVPSFTDRQEISRLSAKMLLEIKAVNFRPDQPYTLTSGLSSPVYIDCRKIISYPAVRQTLMDFAASTLRRDVGFDAFDSVAGGETAGIPFAAWLADLLGLPMQYVRKKPKGFGRAAQIEGDIHPGQRVLLVEDLTTDGGSKIKFAEAIRNAEAEIAHTLVIFYYDIFADSQQALSAHGLSLHYLVTWRDVLAQAADGGYFDTASIQEVEKFLNAPLQWSAAHGGTDQRTNKISS